MPTPEAYVRRESSSSHTRVVFDDGEGNEEIFTLDDFLRQEITDLIQTGNPSTWRNQGKWKKTNTVNLRDAKGTFKVQG